MLTRIVRTMPWIPWLASAALIAYLAWSISRYPPSFASRQLFIRAGLLVAALGLVFIFDDPGAESTDSTPSPLRIRRGIRVLIGMIPWTILVASILTVAARGMRPAFFARLDLETLPIGRLLLEAATIAIWGLAIASVVAKRWDPEPGRFAAPGLLVLYAASWLVPEQWRPWCLPIDARWTTGHPLWWAALLPAVLVTATTSWDSRVDQRWAGAFRNPPFSRPDRTLRGTDLVAKKG